MLSQNELLVSVRVDKRKTSVAFQVRANREWFECKDYLNALSDENEDEKAETQRRANGAENRVNPGRNATRAIIFKEWR